MNNFRIPPNNLDAERAVIGAVMLENSALNEVLSILSTDGQDFYHTAHRTIFQIIVRLIDKGSIAGLVTICEELKNNGTLDKVGGTTYIADIADNTVSAANVRHYAAIVRNKSIERQLITEFQRMVDLVYSPGDDTQAKIDEAGRTILALKLDTTKNTICAARDVAKQTFNNIEFYHKQGGGSITGISTGLHDFDSITAGLHGGDLIIIAARPGMGKTALALNIAAHASLENHIPTLIFSLEMSAQSNMMRIFARQTGIDSRQLQRGFVKNNQWESLTATVSRIAGSPLFIDDKVDQTPTEIRAKARRLKAEHGLGLLIIDYIQLVHISGRHDSREQAVAEISRTLKAIARELDIPVIGLSQLNRQVDGRSNRRPLLSDLRESGAIEQDADIVALIYRDDVYNKSDDNPEKGIAEIDIAKHRNGAMGVIKVRFDARTQEFQNLKI